MPRPKHWKDVRPLDRIFGNYRNMRRRWRKAPYPYGGSGSVAGNPRYSDSRKTDKDQSLRRELAASE